MPDARPYVIWGSAGHAKVLADLIALRGDSVIALFDTYEVPPALGRVPFFVGEAGFSEWLSRVGDASQVRGVVAIGGGRGRDRIAIQQRFKLSGLRVEALMHPQASVSATAELGAGTQVLAQALVAADAVVGEGCILNHRAIVDHECRLGDGVHVAPGATLCGLVTVQDNVFVGAGAVVLPRLTIGENAIVGAGAVVTRDVPANGVVVGSPARSAS